MRVMGVKKNSRLHPIYSAEFKKEVLQTLERENLPVKDIARVYGVSDTSVMNWRKAFRELGEAGLVNQFHGWTSKDGVAAPLREAIVQVKKEHPESGTRRIRDFLSRFRFLGVSKQAVAMALKAEGLAGKPPKTKAHGRKPKRFERALPMDLWQSDIMTFHLKRFYPVYLIGFMDDCSRFLVGWGLYRQQTGQAVCDVLLSAIGEYGLPKEILTDNGRQYYAWRGKTRFQEILEQRGIRHIRSRPHHPQTLGKTGFAALEAKRRGSRRSGGICGGSFSRRRSSSRLRTPFRGLVTGSNTTTSRGRIRGSRDSCRRTGSSSFPAR